jgi:NAD+ synthase
MLMKYMKEAIVKWIQNWFKENGPDCKAVVGISGGKDSSIVAALCVEALGKDRVLGVMMPNGSNTQDSDSMKLVEHLGIGSVTISIEGAYCDIIDNIHMKSPIKMSDQAFINLAPRLRMTTLYAISQSVNGRVANTCNLSEAYIGWETRWGDAVGDFAPLQGLTCSEVIALGRELDLPKELIEKVPSDGLCGYTDEDAFGFTYDEVDRWIRLGAKGDHHTEIMRMHNKNRFKKLDLPHYSPPLIQY